MNRRDQAKLRKKYNRGRYALFNGSSARHVKGTTRSVEKLETVPTVDDPEGLDHVRVKIVEVYVGKISLSKGVINTGRGPNPERMQHYYDRITPESKAITLKEDLGIKDPRYEQVWLETPAVNKLNLANTKSGRLDLYWQGSVYFLVDLDYKEKLIRRSRDYGKKDRALDAVRHRRITWEISIPME